MKRGDPGDETVDLLSAGLEDRWGFFGDLEFALPAIDAAAWRKDVDAGGEPLFDDSPADTIRLCHVGEDAINRQDGHLGLAPRRRRGSGLIAPDGQPVRRGNEGGQQQDRRCLMRNGNLQIDASHQRGDPQQDLKTDDGVERQ